MKTARLIRISSGNEGTFGVFLTDGGWWYTMECPNLGNQRGISCIPVGTYEVTMTYSPGFERVLYIVSHVDERSGIRIHPANQVEELAGCIALGNRYGSNGLISSRPAVESMHKVMGCEPFSLTIQRGM